MRQHRSSRARSLGSSPDGFGIQVPKTADEKAAATEEKFVEEVRQMLSWSSNSIYHNGNDHSSPLSNCPRCAVIALLSALERRKKWLNS